MINGRVLAPLPIVDRAVTCNVKCAVLNVGKIKAIVANSACRLGIIANQLCFETGCSVYHLNMVQAETLKWITNIAPD